MAERLHALKIPEALPVVIQLENTVLDGFLKNLMQALGELGAEVAESKGKASASEVNCVALLKQVGARRHRCRCVRSFSVRRPCERGFAHGICVGAWRGAAGRSRRCSRAAAAAAKYSRSPAPPPNPHLYILQMDELKAEMKQEKAQNAEMREKITRRGEVDDNKVMQLEEELHALKSHTQQHELKVNQQFEKVDLRVNDLDTAIRRLGSSAKAVAELQHEFRELKVSLDALKSSTCSLDQHNLLHKQHDALKREFQATDDSVRAVRVKLDTLGAKIHTRMQKLENAVQGIEGPIELEDDPGPPQDILDDVALLKSNMEALQTRMRRLDTLEEQVESEGVTMEQALKQLDQLTDKIPSVDKRLMNHERRIEDVVRDMDAQKTLVGLRSMTAGGSGGEGEAAAALELALELKRSLNAVKVDQDMLQALNQNLEGDIRNLKAAQSRLKAMTAHEGPVDQAGSDKSGVDSATVRTLFQKCDDMWEVIRDLGERVRAVHVATEHHDPDLVDALYGPFTPSAELAHSANQTDTSASEVSLPPVPLPCTRRDRYSITLLLNRMISAICTLLTIAQHRTHSLTSVDLTAQLHPNPTHALSCSHVHQNLPRPTPRNVAQGGRRGPQEKLCSGKRQFGNSTILRMHGHQAQAYRRHGLERASQLVLKTSSRNVNRGTAGNRPPS